MTPVTPAISGAMIRDLLLCERQAALDIHGDPVLLDPVSAFTRMLWREGLAHETKVLSGFSEGLADIRGLTQSERESGTLSAIEARLPVILGDVIRHNNMIGMPDVLRWTPLGYVASDVKSGAALEGAKRNYKQGYLVQVAHYAHILGRRVWGAPTSRASLTAQVPKPFMVYRSHWDANASREPIFICDCWTVPDQCVRMPT